MLWRTTGIPKEPKFGGASAAPMAAYGNILFTFLDAFQQDSVKTRTYLYAALYYKAEEVNELSTYYYNESMIPQLKSSQAMYNFLSANQLDPAGNVFTENSSDAVTPYNEVVAMYLNRYGMNNSRLDTSSVHNILFNGSTFVSFINSYRTMLGKFNTTSWADLQSQLKNTIRAKVATASATRENYINGDTLQAAMSSNAEAMVMNNGKEIITNAFFIDSDYFFPNQSNHKEIQADNLALFIVKCENFY